MPNDIVTFEVVRRRLSLGSPSIRLVVLIFFFNLGKSGLYCFGEWKQESSISLYFCEHNHRPESFNVRVELIISDMTSLLTRICKDVASHADS